MLAQLQAKPFARRWVVAYSGGLDSTVLLHLVVSVNRQLATPLAICALHINHHLSPNAAAWQAHCQQQAQQWGVDFYSADVAVASEGQGVEAAARDARYRRFENFLTADDCLLMGHHLDDQAETFLLRLLRGAGALGLSAMPVTRQLGLASLYRPLLAITRDALSEYAEQQHLSWVDDDSNASTVFDRNFLRHELFPVLHRRWPQAKVQFAKAAEHLQSAQQLLNDLAALDLANANEQQARYGWCVDLLPLQQLSSERRNNTLRFWCMQRQGDVPELQHLQQIQAQFFGVDLPSTSALVNWGGSSIRYFNQRLYLMPSLPPFNVSTNVFSWDGRHPLKLPSAGQIQLIKVDKVQASTPALHSKYQRCALSVAWRQGGERCTPQGRSGSQSLKKLLQEYQLETWLRDRVPLLFIDGQLAAVGDLWVCDTFAAQLGDEGYSIVWCLYE
jgi:tRNA(Ile)-lysidine synthase